MRAVVALATAAIVLAGCGGSTSGNGSGASEPVPVVHRYIAAFANNDGSTLCSLLTGEVKQRLVRGAAALALLTHRPNALSCADDVRIAYELLGADQVAELRKAKVELVSQTGNGATVRVSLPNGHTANAEVANTAAGWLINTAPAKLLGQREATAGASSPRATSGYEPETLAAYEQQLASGQITAATFNKRIRALHLTLTSGQHMLVHYGRGEQPKLAAALAAKGVHVQVLKPAQAESEVANLRSAE